MSPLRYARFSLVFVVAIVLQHTILSDLRILGGGAALGLLLTLGVAYTRGSNTGAVFGFVCGLIFDLFLVGTPLGLSALSYAIVGYAVGSFEASIVRSSPIVAAIVGGAGTLFGMLVFVSTAAILGNEGVTATRTIGVVLITATINAALAPIVFPVVSWALGDETKMTAGWKAG